MTPSIPPTATVQSTPAPQPAVVPDYLANTPEDSPTVVKPEINFSPQIETIKHYFPRILSIGLTLQGLLGIYKSALFVLVKYPALEAQLVAHQVTESQVNDLTITAIIMTISTILSLILAMRLAVFKTKVAKTITMIIGVCLFFGNALLHDVIVSWHVSEWLARSISQAFNAARGVPQEVVKNVPFLEQTPDGELKSVWYK